MDKVKIKTVELLKVIRENQSKYVNLLEEAKEEYRKEVIKQMQKNLREARNGGEIATVIALRAPHDYTSDYNRTIKMLEMSVDEFTELSTRDFAKYVMDEWEWKSDFMGVASTYLSGKLS